MFFRYRDIHFVPVQAFKRLKGVLLWTGSRKRAGGFEDAGPDVYHRTGINNDKNPFLIAMNQARNYRGDLYGDLPLSGTTVSGFNPVETAGEINRANSFTNVS